MTATINVTFDSTDIMLHIDRPDFEVRLGEVVEWVFHNVPEKFSPMIVFKSMIEDEDALRYYGPFLAITQEIPGADGLQTRVWGIAANPFKTTYAYRAMIQKGVGEDPFDEPYGNSPDSVGKAMVVSTEGKMKLKSRGAPPEVPDNRLRKILELADDNNPITGSSNLKIIPVTQKVVDGTEELVIHDNYLWVQRVVYDAVVWDFSLVPQHEGWFPIVDFIGGEGMAYEAIKNMHFGPFSSLTYTIGRVIGLGHGEVPGGYHYRVAMANISSGRMGFKSSPDPVVDYPEPPGGG